MACSLKIREGVSTLTEMESKFTVPSKVVHFRNLPKECSDEELLDLCSPFGKVINHMCCVGPNKNQGLVEFENINQAISMVSYHASSSNPAQLRGRTIYVQHSDRPEIVVNKFAKGNTLLVTMEGVETGDVSIDVIHSVFSKFGFIHKISTFNKSAGFQALIQYDDIETASLAKNALNRKSIPRYLLPRHVEGCNLCISYSEHRDLNIRFQSNRSRDYTNPMLPINQHSIDRALQPPIPQPTENHVLWASFQNMPYDVTVDVLHSVFSEYGIVQKISIFEKNSQTQALIQYPDVTTATAAKNALEGHCIYDGGYCKLHLSYSRHTDINVKAFSNKSRDYTRPDYSVQVPATSWHNPHAFHAQVYGGQIPSWNPILSYMYGPATFPHQTYAVPPIPAYVLAQSNPMVPGFSPHMQAGYSGFLTLAQQPYYYYG